MSWSAGCGVGGDDDTCGDDERNQTRSLRPNLGWTGASGGAGVCGHAGGRKSQRLALCRSHCMARIREPGGLVKAGGIWCVPLNEGMSKVMYGVRLKERSAHRGWCVLT